MNPTPQRSGPNEADHELSRRWRAEGERYVSAVNAFVRRGLRDGWENVDARDEPQDTRRPMAEAVIEAIRRANKSGDIEGLHERFPRAHAPFVEMLGEKGQSLPVVLLLDDGRIVLRVGAPYEPGRVVVIDDRKVEGLSPEIVSVGRSPGREFFAVARLGGITIHRGWDGPETARLGWPTGQEGVPEGFEVDPILGTPIVTRLIPFDDGRRALLVGPDGVFVIGGGGANRLLPTPVQMREHFDWLRAEFPDDPLTYGLSMEHGAVSPDGRWIAAGHQSSRHYIFDAESLEIVGEIGPLSEYPHHAAFSSGSEVIALNSCHFYSGQTVGVPTDLLPGLTTEYYELDDCLIRLEDGSREYAAVPRGDEFIIGDAWGYLRAFDLAGRPSWQHFIGSTVGDMDISPDGGRLAVTTYAGFLCILDLDTGEADPSAIGTATHRERRRWLFWKDEPRPLIW